ncbi:hypothetical protein [Duganella qianjiadongensis]|uniref:Peptidase MA-like domain-containing protein n=1 Tax=Duganella qianjiadongensis TaxID=2692176 RepID=A0ABW9VT02_9BURK|nr:hypothetical protein [Duganella qianjiadongensis]MYM42187.1 hypothetical protein [Duganella qianjiadongensis]
MKIIFLKWWFILPPKPKSNNLFDIIKFGLQWSITLISVGFIILQFMPEFLFPHNVSFSTVTIYSTRPLPPETKMLVDKSVKLVEKSELANSNQRNQVFVSDRFGVYNFFAPMNEGFAITNLLTGNTIVARGDIRENTSYATAATFNKRTLSSVIAHELTHLLIRDRLGLINGLRTPAWVVEGYCDYIAGESSFPEHEGMKLLAERKANESPSFRYFQGRVLMRYLIEERHMSFEQIAVQARQSDALQKEALLAVQREAAAKMAM